MHFDAAKSPARHGFGNYLMNSPSIALSMNEGKPNEAIGLLGDNPRSVGVCLPIVAVEG
jgi:hypothetical protein